MKGLIKLWFVSAVLALCFLGGGLTSSAFAGLVNSDFSDAFTGWTGDLIPSTSSDGEGYEVNPGDYSDNFTIVSSGVTLTTTTEYCSVYIYQDFFVPENATTLSFNINWIPTSSFFDTAESVLSVLDFSVGDITLFDYNSVNGLISADISSLAGAESRLRFGLVDMDGIWAENTDDTLTITNIQLLTDSGSPASTVPIPGSLPLMAAGLLGLGLFRFWRNN